MFSKSFEEMMQVDVAPYVKQRDDKSDVDYLPWAACKWLLHENGAEVVMFWPVPGPDGSSLRKSELEFGKDGKKINRCYEVLVRIKVDDLEWDTAYPVLNGNNPVSDDTMSQLRLHNAIRRAFVKGVAERTGLGFGLWLKEDDLPVEKEEDLNKHSIFKCKVRFQQLITAKLTEGHSAAEIAKAAGMEDENELRLWMNTRYKEIARVEETIKKMEAPCRDI